MSQSVPTQAGHFSCFRIDRCSRRIKKYRHILYGRRALRIKEKCEVSVTVLCHVSDKLHTAMSLVRCDRHEKANPMRYDMPSQGLSH